MDTTTFTLAPSTGLPYASNNVTVMVSLSFLTISVPLTLKVVLTLDTLSAPFLIVASVPTLVTVTSLIPSTFTTKVAVYMPLS